jgi:hypothetical protein
MNADRVLTNSILYIVCVVEIKSTMPAIHSTPVASGAYRPLNTVYFMHVGARTTLAEFMWTVQTVCPTNMDDIICISHCIHAGHLHYFVEFTSMNSLDLFLSYTEKGIMKTNTGAIFVPVDIHNRTTIVTVSGLHSAISDSDICGALASYGEPASVVWGFHWVGQPIYNGKRYVIFHDGILQDIPASINIQGTPTLIMYPNQPKTCFGCGSLAHLLNKCTKQKLCANSNSPRGFSRYKERLERFSTNSIDTSPGKQLFTPGEIAMYTTTPSVDIGTNTDYTCGSLVDMSTNTDLNQTVPGTLSTTVDVGINTDDMVEMVDTSTSTDQVGSVDKGVQCPMKGKQKKVTRDVASWAKITPKYKSQEVNTVHHEYGDKLTQTSKPKKSGPNTGVQCVHYCLNIHTQTELAYISKSQVSQSVQTALDPLKDSVDMCRNKKQQKIITKRPEASKGRVFPNKLKTKYWSSTRILQQRQKLKTKFCSKEYEGPGALLLASSDYKFKPNLSQTTILMSMLYMLEAVKDTLD